MDWSTDKSCQTARGKGWQFTSDNVYLCFTVEQMTTDALQMASPHLHLVTQAMEHALFARFPWRRYLPGWEAKLFYKLLSLLPAILTDLIFSLALNFLLKRKINQISSNASRRN